MTQILTPFTPQVNGFRFINRFDALPELKLPLIGPFDPGTLIIGLCGGMCYSALDYYHGGVPIPTEDKVEELPDPLLKMLYRRQTDSLTLRSLGKVFSWMLRGDAEVLQLTVDREIPRLVESIAMGSPVVLCLIRAEGLGNPTLNHQVVAVGIDVDPAQHGWKILLYDPNHPLEEPYLWVEVGSTGETRCSQSTGEALRGFFRMTYQPRPVA